MNTTRQQESPDYEGSEVRLCTDGKYRWTYPMNMLTNPAPAITVCKIFGCLAAMAFCIFYAGAIIRGEFDRIAGDLKWWGVAVLVFLAIFAVAYLIVAAQHGFRYIVRFTMDENGITHEQAPAQRKTAGRIGEAVAAGGALAGSIGRVGQGLMVASHTSLSSDFKAVRSVRPHRLWRTINMNEPFAHNQVYTTKEDFDFVLDYIRSHCPKAK